MQLDYENLKKYVNTVLQLEKEKMVLENTYSKMVKKRNSMGQYVQLPEPPKKRKMEEKVTDGNGYIISMALSSIAIFVACIYLISCLWNQSNITMFVVFLSIGIFIFLIGLIFKSVDYQKMRENNEKIVNEDYENRCNQYNNIILEDARRRDRELALIPQMNNDINTIVDEYNKINELLKSYYSLDVIYPSYHGDFVAIAMFSQYLNMGMCYTLTGHEGCYTLYEQQKLQGIIITKLNVIISQLDEISGQLRSLQYSLLQAISETNEKIDKLTVYAKEHGNLQQQHNAVMEYKADCMESEMKFHNQYVMLRDLINK